MNTQVRDLGLLSIATNERITLRGYIGVPTLLMKTNPISVQELSGINLI